MATNDADLRLTDDDIEGIGNLRLKRRVRGELGTLLFETNRGNAWLGGRGTDGDLLIGDGSTTYDDGLSGDAPTPRIHLDGGHGYGSADQEHVRAYLSGRHGNLKLGGDGADGDLEIRGQASDDATGRTFPRIYLDGNSSPGAFLKPKLLTEIRAYVSGRHGNLTLGGKDGEGNQDGDLILRGSRTVKKGTLWKEMGMEAWQDFDPDDEPDDSDRLFTPVMPYPDLTYTVRSLDVDDGTQTDGGDPSVDRLLAIDPSTLGDEAKRERLANDLPNETGDYLASGDRIEVGGETIEPLSFGSFDTKMPTLGGEPVDPNDSGSTPIDPRDGGTVPEPIDPNTGGPVPGDWGVGGDKLPGIPFDPDAEDAIDFQEQEEAAEREAHEETEMPTPRIHLDAGGGPREVAYLRAYINGESGRGFLGGDGKNGQLRLRNGEGETAATLDAETGIEHGGNGNAGRLSLTDSIGRTTAQLDAGGRLELGGAGEVGPVSIDRTEGTVRSADLHWGSTTPIWNNAGDVISVYDDGDEEVLRWPYPDGTGRVRNTDLRVVEIEADPDGSDRENLLDEFVVFENAGIQPLDLTGWRVEDEVGTLYAFPSDLELAPAGTVRLRTGMGEDVIERLENEEEPAEPQDGDATLVLKAAGGAVAGTVRAGADGLVVRPSDDEDGPELRWDPTAGTVSVGNAAGEETFSLDVETGDVAVAGDLTVGGDITEA